MCPPKREMRVSEIKGQYRSGQKGKIFTISGIFFLYNFLVRLYRKSGTFCLFVPKPDLPPGTPGTLRVIYGIFFMYNFLVRDPGKQVQCAGSAGGLSFSGTGRSGPHPSPLKPGGWPRTRECAALNRSSHAVYYCRNRNGHRGGYLPEILGE